MKTFRLLFIIGSLTTLFSCNYNSFYVDRVEDKNDAEKITDKYYDLIKNENYDATTSFFANEFWNVTSKEKLKELFLATQKKLGDLKTTKLDHWQTKIVEGSNPSAEYVLFYLNQYQNYEAKETLRLIKETDGKIKIVAFNINSDGFMK